MTATSRAAYCRLCWAAAELVLTCTASRAPQDRNVTFTLLRRNPDWGGGVRVATGLRAVAGTTLLRTEPDGTITLTTDGEQFARDVAPVLDMLAATGH